MDRTIEGGFDNFAPPITGGLHCGLPDDDDRETIPPSPPPITGGLHCGPPDDDYPDPDAGLPRR